MRIAVFLSVFITLYGSLHYLANGAFLYVSRGSGTWGPPMRLLAPPEVTIIDLVHGKRENS